jgi:hypothetical protein
MCLLQPKQINSHIFYFKWIGPLQMLLVLCDGAAEKSENMLAPLVVPFL